MKKNFLLSSRKLQPTKNMEKYDQGVSRSKKIQLTCLDFFWKQGQDTWSTKTACVLWKVFSAIQIEDDTAAEAEAILA